MSKPMTLGELIDTLSRKDPEDWLLLDFVHFQPSGDVHSYRGDYSQLAIGYRSGGDMTVGAMLEKLKAADGAMFYGYKGGEYVMDRDTPVFVANHNESGGTAIVDVKECVWCLRLITANVD